MLVSADVQFTSSRYDAQQMSMTAVLKNPWFDLGFQAALRIRFAFTNLLTEKATRWLEAETGLRSRFPPR
ncbi:MAG: hypothetical protein DCC56_06870 [Anaerolineae bacterium]|nr:MAG: hypothetical protein DCC56_06870 [Anaerolineae bacterium]